MEYPIILKSKSMEIRLENHDLPEPPLSFSSGVNIKKTYYPGNPDPTVQVMNVYGTEIEFSGTFKDIRNADGYAKSRIQDLLDMKNKAEEVILQYANYIFTGMLEEITSSIYNIHEIGYRIKYSIFREIHEKVQKPIISTKEIDLVYLNDLKDDIQTSFQSISSIPTNISTQWGNLTNQITHLTETINVNDQDESIKTISSAILSDIKNLTKLLCTLPKNEIHDTTNTFSVIHSLQTVKQEVFKIIDTQNSEVTNELTHIVTQDENLYDIAKKYLNSSTRWTEIAKLNNLKDTNLTMGMKLVIPQ